MPGVMVVDPDTGEILQTGQYEGDRETVKRFEEHLEDQYGKSNLVMTTPVQQELF